MLLLVTTTLNFKHIDVPNKTAEPAEALVQTHTQGMSCKTSIRPASNEHHVPINTVILIRRR